MVAKSHAKKNSKEKEKGKSPKLSKKEQEKLLEELTKEVEKEKKSGKEDEGEENAEDAEGEQEERKARAIGDSGFQGFSANVGGLDFEDSETPALERIAGEQPGEEFIPRARAAAASSGAASGTGAAGILAGNENDANGFSYLSNSGNEDEPKYLNSSGEVYREPERVEVENLGRDNREIDSPDQETLVRSARAVADLQNNSQGRGEIGKAWGVERFDENQSRKKKGPFDEAVRIKYDDYKAH